MQITLEVRLDVRRLTAPESDGKVLAKQVEIPSFLPPGYSVAIDGMVIKMHHPVWDVEYSKIQITVEVEETLDQLTRKLRCSKPLFDHYDVEDVIKNLKEDGWQVVSR